MNAESKPASWRAVPVPPEARQHYFDEVASYSSELARTARRARNAGWIVGAIGTAAGVAGIVSAATLFPLKRTEVQFFEVDKSTGYIGSSLAATDAPRLFSEQTAYHALRDYVDAREGYVPETDDLMFHKAAVMSSPDEQQRYAAMRKAPLSPPNVLGRTGYARVDDFHISPIGSGKAHTFVYLVRFDRVVVRGGQAQPTEHWSATIEFQWHPELPMSAQDRLVNPGGFQAIAYQAQPDTDPSRTH